MENILKKYDFIDALRGLAVLAVVLVHTANWSNYSFHGISGWLASRGSRGVQLFYLVSAFTLFHSMHIRNAKETRPILNFFIRRFFRIAPMFYVAVALYLALYGLGPRYWLGDAKGISAANIISTLSFTNGFNPYWISSVVPGGWSVAVEMMFYALLPALFRWVTSLKKAMLFLMISYALMVILRYFFLKNIMISDPVLWHDYLFLYLPSQLPVFALGILLYFLWQDEKKLPSSSILITVLGFSGFACFIIIAYSLHGKHVPEHILFGIAFGLMAFALGRRKNYLFVNKLTEWAGKLSFSMYLLHDAVLYFLSGAGWLHFNLVFNFIITALITGIFSWIAFYCVEKPFQSLGKQLISFFETKIKDNMEVTI